MSSAAETVRHTHKIRTTGERMEPGGGGLNVARVLSRLGVNCEAIFLGGGVTGRVLDELLERGGIARRMIPIADDTRLSLTVVETSTGKEYRFVPEGPEVSQAEAKAALQAASTADCDYLVASGSLPRGIPAEFYARLGGKVAERGARFVVDTSGAALKAVLDAGGLFLAKPSRGEFEAFVGRKLSKDEVAGEAERLVASGKVENLAVTLGRDGAVLATRDGVFARPAIEVETCSAVGAGDSFLAAMVYGFGRGCGAEQALQLGLAAGAAAAISCGSELARAEDLRRLMAPLGSGEEVDDLGSRGDGV